MNSSFLVLVLVAIGSKHYPGVLAKYYATEAAIADDLLVNYDKEMHPSQAEGLPTKISIKPILEEVTIINPKDQLVEMIMEFTSVWDDARFNYSNFNYSKHISYVTFIDTRANGWQVWKPAFLWRTCSHVEALASFYRVYERGNVQFNEHLHLRCRCKFSFGQLPFHSQQCHIPVEVFATPVSSVELSSHDFLVYEQHDPTWKNISMSCQTNQYKYNEESEAHSRLVLTLSFDHDSGGDVIGVIVPVIIFVLIAYGSSFIAEHPSRNAVSILTALIVNVAISKVYADLPSHAIQPWLIDFLYGCLFFNLSTAFLAIIVDYSNSELRKWKATADAETGGAPKGVIRVWHRVSKHCDHGFRIVFIVAFLIFLIVMFAIVDHYPAIVQPLHYKSIAGTSKPCR